MKLTVRESHPLETLFLGTTTVSIPRGGVYVQEWTDLLPGPRDYVIIAPSLPMRMVEIFATAAGRMTPDALTGEITDSSKTSVAFVKVKIVGIDAITSYIGVAPRCCFRASAGERSCTVDHRPGTSVPVAFSVEGEPTSSRVTIAVK